MTMLLQCLLSVLEGKEHEERLAMELHHNEAFEDDEGIAESGMWLVESRSRDHSAQLWLVHTTRECDK